jgi:choice-of-anchor B domain-containing protein
MRPRIPTVLVITGTALALGVGSAIACPSIIESIKPRECVEEYVPDVSPTPGLKEAYDDGVLGPISCAGVPMQRMKAEKCVDGMAGMFPCKNVNLQSFIPLSEMGATWSNDIWGWTDPKTDREYALIGLGNGTGFVDVTKSKNPRWLGMLPTHTVASTWRDLEVVNNHVYVVSEASGHGLQVFDLTRLRGVKEPKTWTEDAHVGGFGQAHTVTVDPKAKVVHVNGARSGVTICQNGGGGPIMLDVSKPAEPKLEGCNGQDGYTHDMQCVIYDGPDSKYVGREICLGSNEDTLTITDVTNKDNPKQLSRTSYATAAYVHQGWLTKDHKYFLSNDELDEANGEVNTTVTYMWDMRDLDNPIMMGGFDHGTQSIDHQLFIKGDVATESNYMSGLRVLGTEKLKKGKLDKLGYFDVYPAQDGVDFAGTWANYPYFDSGIVVVTGMEEGLFVVKPTGKAGKSLRVS